MHSKRAALAVVLACAAPVASAQTSGELISGSVDFVSLEDPTDVWSGGTIVVGGQKIVIPRNLLIDLPANRLTLQQLYADAPASALARGESGLAAVEPSAFSVGIATILANRTPAGNVIAGHVEIAKGTEAVTGTVTYVDHTDGYLVIDGAPGDPGTGLMIRINDPDSRYSIQQGRGCDGGPNCSPDVRYGVDPDNYTIVFSNGYPAGIPSTVPVGSRSGFRPGTDDPGAASNAAGVGDPFCPATNRASSPVPNSTRFAPIQVGDEIAAEGNFEFVAGEYFLSVHSLTVFQALSTSPDPSQPDYIIFDEAEWDVPAFQNERVRALFIGFSTLPTSQLDIFALHVDPATNENNEFPIGSTVGNPDTINQGVGANPFGIFKINYDVDFLVGVDPEGAPCQNLLNAGFAGVCPLGGTLAENFRVLSPVSREIIGRSRRVMNPGVETRDVNGNTAPFGEYLTPVGLGFPEFVEIDLNRLATPFAFSGIPWNLDRRLGPGGCDGPCETARQPLDPFPFEALDPRFQAAIPGGQQNRILSFFPFGGLNVLPWPPDAPAAEPITPTVKRSPGGATPLIVASFGTSALTGEAPLTVSFTDESTGTVTDWLWLFGDGATSTEQNPTHVYDAPGDYTPVLIVSGPDGSDTTAIPNGVSVAEAVLFDIDFISNRTSGPAPLTVRFIAVETNGTATSGLWDFGDGGSSNLRRVNHTYAAPGVYTVSLTAEGPQGPVVETKTDYITVTP